MLLESNDLAPNEEREAERLLHVVASIAEKKPEDFAIAVKASELLSRKRPTNYML